MITFIGGMILLIVGGFFTEKCVKKYLGPMSEKHRQSDLMTVWILFL